MIDRVVRGVAALLMAVAVVPQVDARQMGGIGITVYENAGYRGENATFRDNEPDLGRARLANRISSLQVAPGEVWEVCEGINYRPPCQVFSGSESNLARRNWNDRISSLRRVRGGDGPGRSFPGGGGFPSGPGGSGTQPGRSGLVLYSNENFGGEARRIAGFTSSLGSFNDKARSVRVFSGRWELCEGSEYRKCRIIDRDWPDLGGIGLSARVSSVRPVAGRGGDDGFPGRGFPGGPGGDVPGNPGQGRARLILYDRDRYRGDSRTFDSPSNALGGFGNRSQSAQVSGAWELCDRPNFAGRCVTVSQDVPNLASYGINNRVSSARPVGGRPR